MNNIKGIKHPCSMADINKINFTFPSKDVCSLKSKMSYFDKSFLNLLKKLTQKKKRKKHRHKKHLQLSRNQIFLPLILHQSCQNSKGQLRQM